MAKKILYGIICLFTITIFTNRVFANSFVLSLNSEDTFDDEIILTLKVNNLSGFSSGLYGLDAVINYDKTKLQLVEMTGLSGFEVVYDINTSNRFVMHNSIGAMNNTDILTIKFKNVSLEEDENISITLSDLIASDGENDINGTDVSKTIKYVAPEFEKGDLNKNGKIDLSDIIVLLKMYLGNIIPTQEQIKLGDLDGNGVIGLKDIITLLKTYLGT